MSLILGDIDNFKLYNDTYGHKKGDDCLVSVAHAIQSSLKRPGDFCARYGGEEFVIILPNTPISGAMAIAESVRANVESLGLKHEKSLPYGYVSISLGVATAIGKENKDHEQLIKRADLALYSSKSKGRNCVTQFDEQLSMADTLR